MRIYLGPPNIFYTNRKLIFELCTCVHEQDAKQAAEYYRAKTAVTRHVKINFCDINMYNYVFIEGSIQICMFDKLFSHKSDKLASFSLAQYIFHTN